MTDRSRELIDALHEAAEHMDRCSGGSPEEAKRCFRVAFERVVRVRNHLLAATAHEREGGTPGSSAESRGGALQLEQLNALLSVMTSFDFPLAGFHAERLEGAQRELRALLEEAQGKGA